MLDDERLIEVQLDIDEKELLEHEDDDDMLLQKLEE